MSLASICRTVAVVTGGTRGVGAGIARAFLRGRCRGRGLRAQAAGRPGRGGRSQAHFRALDLRDAAAVRAFFAASPPTRPAGLSWSTTRAARPTGCSGRPTPTRHARVVELNLLAPLTASLAAYEVMRTGRRRLDHHDRQRQRHPPLARHRRLRRGQGRPGPPRPLHGRRMGPEGTGQHPRPRHGAHRTRRTCTTATRRHRGRRATVPLGRLAEPAESATPASSSPPTAPRISPARACSSTAAGSAPPSSTPPPSTTAPRPTPRRTPT